MKPGDGSVRLPGMNATDARSRWLREQDRRRFRFSLLLVLGAYLLVLSTVWLVSLFSPDQYANVSGPVVVRLGRPEGLDLPVQPQATQPPQPSPPAPPSQAEAAAPATPPSPAPVAPTSQAAPSAATAPAASAPAAPPAPAVQPVPAAPPAPVQEIIARGTEAGNSYDMMVEGGEGRVAASGMIPIHWFMPLPVDLPDSLYQNIPDKFGLPGTAAERRADFSRVYEQSGGSWVLRGRDQPDYDLRLLVWPVLEAAGYDLTRADYKEGRNLRPVEIRFTILPHTQDSLLADISISRSSGYSNIDDAVRAGLQRAQFSNANDRRVSGTYTYRF